MKTPSLIPVRVIDPFDMDALRGMVEECGFVTTKFGAARVTALDRRPDDEGHELLRVEVLETEPARANGGAHLAHAFVRLRDVRPLRRSTFPSFA